MKSIILTALLMGSLILSAINGWSGVGHHASRTLAQASN
jgi:predicted small secreted protein